METRVRLVGERILQWGPWGSVLWAAGKPTQTVQSREDQW